MLRNLFLVALMMTPVTASAEVVETPTDIEEIVRTAVRSEQSPDVSRTTQVNELGVVTYKLRFKRGGTTYHISYSAIGHHPITNVQTTPMSALVVAVEPMGDKAFAALDYGCDGLVDSSIEDPTLQENYNRAVAHIAKLLRAQR